MAVAAIAAHLRRIARIHVTGNAGAGKTRLARRLAHDTGLPLHHLDPIVWRSGWRKAPRRDRLRAEAELLAGAERIVEGVSSLALSLAHRTAPARVLRITDRRALEMLLAGG